MALPQDQPNPVPDWARDLKAATAAGAAGMAAPAGPTVATPPPEYGNALAAYVHSALADAFHTVAEAVRQSGDAGEPRTVFYNAMEGVARIHADHAARYGENAR